MAIRNNLNWHFIPDQFCREKRRREERHQSFWLLRTNQGYEFECFFKHTGHTLSYRMTPFCINSCPFGKPLRHPDPQFVLAVLDNTILQRRRRRRRGDKLLYPDPDCCRASDRVHNEYPTAHNEGWTPFAKVSVTTYRLGPLWPDRANRDVRVQFDGVPLHADTLSDLWTYIARQLDREGFNTEISLIHLGNFQTLSQS